MPARPAYRPLRLQPPGLSLALSIALGIWLGFVLVALTAWVASRLGYALPTSPPPAVEADAANWTPAGATATAPRPAPPAPDPGAGAMFEQYQQNLHGQALRETEAAARANPANQANARCQFWLEQAQTVATDASREQAARFCN